MRGKNKKNEKVNKVEKAVKKVTDPIEKVGKEFKIVFTPLCGTGNKPIRRALSEVGFENILVVKEEENPDPNFAGIEYPNPEEQKALTRGIELAKENGADLVIATDPDCDRVGVAVKTTTGDYALLTGNQIGGLLTDYIIEGLKEKGELKENSTLIKTIVTSEFGADIAKANNVEVLNVLTGFKFIGEKIKSFEENNNEKTYLFGYEESYGYLVGTHARDKDGVVASVLISEMAAYYYSKGMSLYEGLQELYKKYGYFKEKTISLTLKGIEGLAKIKEIITYFRENDIKEFNNTKMDINAMKLKKVNLTKKIENASAFIAEIDSHKKSIFEFWKYSNKDEVKTLAEGEAEVVNVKPHAKIFDFEEDFEEFGTTMDQIQRKKFNKEELDAIYIASTEQIEPLNKVKTNSLEPKELDKYLKTLKAEQKELKGKLDEELDIFGGLEEDTRKIKKLANKTHRENPKNKFLILGLTKQYKVVDYKVNLSQSIWRINEALSKMTTSQEIIAYMWTEDGVTIDANKINIFNLDAEDEIKKAIEKSEDNKINLYKIKLGKGSNVIAFSNCIYYDNQNKTLPVGMDNDTRIIAKLSDMNIELDSKKVIKVGKLDDEEMGTKLIVKNINILEYTVKQMEEE